MMGLDDALASEAAELARTLAIEARADERRAERSRRRMLARVVADPAGLPLVLGLTDEVMRVRDDRRAARRFADVVARGVPAGLPVLDRLALRLGAATATAVPSVVMPLVRRRIKHATRGLVLSAEPRPLTRYIERRRRAGIDLNINLLGEAILGEEEAARRVEAVRALVRRDDVDYVSVKISSVSSRIDSVAFDATVDELVERLMPLFTDAASAVPPVFVNLDMEEYRDLGLTVAVFRALLSRPELHAVDAGIAFQAYLPDGQAAMEELCAFAAERRAAGGGRIKVRVVKGANLAMERVDAELHGWPQAPYDDKRDVDANYKHLLDVALRPEHASAVRLGVASHNLFDVAWAITLVRHLGAEERVDIEMLEGMAPAQARAVRRHFPSIRLYAPVVPAEEYDASISYLARRLEENAQPGNFLREAFDLEPDGPEWEAQAARFREAVRRRHDVDGHPRRTQDRSQHTTPCDGAFANAADTDFSLPANRRWLAAALATPLPRSIGTGRPMRGIDPSSPDRELYRWHAADRAQVDTALRTARAVAPRWAAQPPSRRATLVARAGDELERRRGQLIAAMVSDAGKRAVEADTEVSEAVDFARYYASCATELEQLSREGVRFEPYRVTVVVPPWNFPVAIPAGGVLAALAAGSAVVLKPAPETVLCGALVAEACWAAGVPQDVLQLVPCADDEAGRALVSNEHVDGVILTGAEATARLFQSWRPTQRLHAETSGKNAVVVTAAADYDAAVRDVVRSAFGHAGQKCSAASLLICEASVYDDERFLAKLADATRSLLVGPVSALRSVVGPLIRPPEEALRRGLTQLDDGEAWLVQPRCLDTGGHLWSPGIRIGVRPGSWFHQTECFGPVLGVMRASSLDEAVDWQNATRFGLTAGIHSLDDAEVDRWLRGVEAGNCYVNRQITGAIVRRQPFGGWKASSVGPTGKAGGPNYVLALGRWHDADGAPDARASYAHWHEQLIGRLHDPSGLHAERNVLRYLPLPLVVLRLGSRATEHDRLRAERAAACTGTPVLVSTAAAEDDDAFAARLDALGATRLRIVGGASDAVYQAAHAAGVDVDDNPVVSHGRIELLRWVREQAISITAHRYGNVRRLTLPGFSS